MVRTMILGTVAALAIAFGGQAATAQDPYRGPFGPQRGYYPPSYPQPRHDHDYVVYVRHHGHWDRYGRFDTRREAERVALRLEDRGYRVRVEVIEVGCNRW